jgi:hypothetical protein
VENRPGVQIRRTHRANVIEEVVADIDDEGPRSCSSFIGGIWWATRLSITQLADPDQLNSDTEKRALTASR